MNSTGGFFDKLLMSPRKADDALAVIRIPLITPWRCMRLGADDTRARRQDSIGRRGFECSWDAPGLLHLAGWLVEARADQREDFSKFADQWRNALAPRLLASIGLGEMQIFGLGVTELSWGHTGLEGDQLVPEKSSHGPAQSPRVCCLLSGGPSVTNSTPREVNMLAVAKLSEGLKRWHGMQQQGALWPGPIVHTKIEGDLHERNELGKPTPRTGIPTEAAMRIFHTTEDALAKCLQAHPCRELIQGVGKADASVQGSSQGGQPIRLTNTSCWGRVVPRPLKKPRPAGCARRRGKMNPHEVGVIEGFMVFLPPVAEKGLGDLNRQRGNPPHPPLNFNGCGEDIINTR